VAESSDIVFSMLPDSPERRYGKVVTVAPTCSRDKLEGVRRAPDVEEWRGAERTIAVHRSE